MNHTSILVVEDERIVAKDIQISLEQLGYTVPAIAASGIEAINKAAENVPDLVLMDINLKGDMDGVEAARHINTRFNVPVIYLTAYSDDQTLERAKLTDPIGYILKPFKARELHAAIQMAINKHQMEKKLKKHDQWLAAVLKSIGEGLIATDIKGLVTYMNPVAEKLTGWKQSEAFGRYVIEVFNIVDSKTQTKIANPAIKVLQEGAAFCLAEYLLLIAKDGAEIPIAECTAPIQDDLGNLAGVVINFRDITKLQQAEAEIRKALVKEKELNKFKSHFISTTSHEFRTPLATILSSADLLEYYGYRWAESKKLAHLGRIQTAAENMTKLLDDVLLVNKAEAGKLEFNPVPLNLVNFCDNLVQEMQLIAGTKHIINFVRYCECTNVRLDEKLLRHIFTNLLSNAIKYSPQGGTIEFSLMCNESSAVFSIKDNGIGIPEVDQAQLFESFHRASNVGSTSGTGLGLTIVKKAVELHGGEIVFNSQVGVGTTFTVTIPHHQLGVKDDNNFGN